MTEKYWTVLTTVLMAFCPLLVSPQASGPEATENYRFYMDSTKDCNGPVFNVFDKETVILGQSSGAVQQSPLSCTIRLATENNFEKTRFQIIVRAMQIDDEDVKFAIYDGDTDQLLLMSFDSNTGASSVRPTTGNKVSFLLTRRDVMNTQYYIEVVARPLIAGVDPGYDNDWGNDYGYFNRLVPNMVIYIIVGVLFLIVIVIVVIVAVVCHRKHKGLNKKPEQYKISYIANNGNLSRGPASEVSTKNWVTTSRNSLRRDRRHHTQDEDDSVFNDSEESYPSKKRYNPDRSYENTNYRDRNQRQDRYNSRPSYRNNSFVQADDDHPQDTYIQREIKPRVKSTRETYESEEEEDVESIGVGPDEEEASEEEEEETEEEQESEEEESEAEEEPEDVDSGGIHQPPPSHVPDQPPPRLGHQPMSGIPQPAPRHLPPHDQHHSYPADPSQMPVAGPYGPRFVVYPGQPRPQLMHMAPGIGQFQPIQGPTMTMPPPPRYPGHPSHEPQRPYQVKPSDPPIYSYLVQRGYNPEDGRDSPVSVSTNASAKSDTRLIQPEDSDLSAHNLDAGVEYMRR